MFVGQDHRVLRETKIGRERLSAWDQDIIRWRQWAVANARGYEGGRAAPPNMPAESLATSPDSTPNGDEPSAVRPGVAPSLAMAGGAEP